LSCQLFTFSILLLPPLLIETGLSKVKKEKGKKGKKMIMQGGQGQKQ
jgi:hypothetical protein